MKKILRTALTLSLVWLGSCTNYDEDFDNLNQRIDALENQIAGFSELSNGLNALDTKVNSLSEVLANVPNTSDFSSSVEDIQEQINILQAALAELDVNDSGIQDQVDLLNEALAALTDDMKQVLRTNNVIPTDIIILNEGALDGWIAATAEMETIIVDGAFVIDGSWADGIAPEFDGDGQNFDLEKVNQLTSKIVAILGHDLSLNYQEGSIMENYYSLDDYGYSINGYMDSDGDIYLEEVMLDFDGLDIQLGDAVWAGEIDSVEGDPNWEEVPPMLDFSNLVTLNGAFDINEIYDAGVDMSGLINHAGQASAHYALDEISDSDAMGEVEYNADNVLSTFVLDGTLGFEEVDLKIDLSSLMNSFNLYFYDTGMIDLSSLVSVHHDLYTEMVGPLTAPVLTDVGEDLILEYGGGYDFPVLRYVGDDLWMRDYGTDSEYGAPTLRVNFPALAYTGDQIRVYDMESGDLDNEFTLAEYVNILGYFDNDYDWQEDGNEYGLGAPNATTVIINGDTTYEEDKSIIMADLYLYAPNADVTLNFTETYDDYGDGDLYVEFKTLTAANLDYIDGDMHLVGQDGDGEQEVTVTLPELLEIDGTDGTYVSFYNLYEIIMPKYVANSDTMFMSYDLIKFTAASIYDDYVDLEDLESLTLTALQNDLDFDDLDEGYDYGGLDEDDLTDVNITGINCNANVYIGFNGDYETDFDSLETITLGGVLNQVHIVGADALTTINTSGTITSYDEVSNDAVTTRNILHTPGDCITE